MRPLKPQPAVHTLTGPDDLRAELERVPCLNHADPQSPGRHFSPQMDSRDDLRAGLEGVPSRDHAEPQSAWPLEPATRFWSIASKDLPRRYGPREGTPLQPH